MCVNYNNFSDEETALIRQSVRKYYFMLHDIANFMAQKNDLYDVPKEQLDEVFNKINKLEEILNKLKEK